MSSSRRLVALFSKETREQVLLAMKAGHYPSSAAKFAGIEEEDLYEYLEYGRQMDKGVAADFFREFGEAESFIEDKALKAWTKAFDTDWRAAAAFLEHRHGDKWGKKTSVDISVGPRDDGKKSKLDKLTRDQKRVFARQLAMARTGRLPAPEDEDEDVIDAEVSEFA